jgi:hypothetical protein
MKSLPYLYLIFSGEKVRSRTEIENAELLDWDDEIDSDEIAEEAFAEFLDEGETTECWGAAQWEEHRRRCDELLNLRIQEYPWA